MTEVEYEAERERWRKEREAARKSPPVRSDIREGTAAARYWCALLDGRPVAHCCAFDGEAGWVIVSVVAEVPDGRALRTTARVRLFGHVEAIWYDDYESLCERSPAVAVFAVSEAEWHDQDPVARSGAAREP